MSVRQLSNHLYLKIALLTGNNITCSIGYYSWQNNITTLTFNNANKKSKKYYCYRLKRIVHELKNFRFLKMPSYKSNLL